MYPSSIPPRLSALFIAVLLTVGLAACQPSGEPSSQRATVDTAAVLASIDSMRALYEKSAAERDFKTLASMRADGAITVGPGGPKWNSFMAASEKLLPPGTQLDIKPIEAGVLSKEWAYDFGVTTVTYTPDGASEPRTLHTTSLLLFRKTKDGWKMYREVASPALPPDSLMEQ